MQKLFHYDSPFIKWVNRMGRIVILNILWVLCCIPILTIGASTTAMYRVAMALAERKEDVSVTGDFFRAFRSNFKPATLVWLILLIPTVLIILNLSMLISGAFRACCPGSFHGKMIRTVGFLLYMRSRFGVYLTQEGCI